jgi:hypothetical protein
MQNVTNKNKIIVENNTLNIVCSGYTCCNLCALVCLSDNEIYAEN